MSTNDDTTLRAPQFRYGPVFLIAVVLLVFQIVAPSEAWARAVSIGLGALALIVVVATSRRRAAQRRRRVLTVALPGAAVVTLIALGVVSDQVAFLLGAGLAAAVPAALAGGTARLIRERGVTIQAVLGALTIYVFVGLLFAWAIAFVAAVDSAPYFAQGDLTQGQRVYFSFTTMTTTGFGDYTAQTPVGQAIAVVEMLVGQLYLVTVIGILVGNMGRRRRRPEEAG